MVKGHELRLSKENLTDIKKFATVNPNLNLTVNKVIEEFSSNRFLSGHTISEVAPRLTSEQKALLTKPLVKPSLPIAEVAAITGEY